MKKYILSTLILFLFSTSFCQNTKVSLGPEIGMNIIPIENTAIGYNFQLGYHFGLHLKYKFTESFKLSTGVFLSQKKKKYDATNISSIFDIYGDLIQMSGIDTSGLDSTIKAFGVNTDVIETTNGMASELFIEIPVLANYKFRNFNMYAGPYAGILLTANKKEEIRTQIPLLNVIDFSQFDSTGLSSFFLPSADETTTSSESNKDNLRLLDFGFNVGIGYEMNNLHFNLMYSHGLLDYRQENNGEKKENLKLIRISIVYLFDLKKKTTENSARFE